MAGKRQTIAYAHHGRARRPWSATTTAGVETAFQNSAATHVMTTPHRVPSTITPVDHGAFNRHGSPGN